MRWFRFHGQAWGWLALSALALQLGLSFGHIHGTHADHPIVAVAATADTGNVPDTDDPSDADYCATCAIVALLSGAQTASPPIVAPPAVWAAPEIASDPETAPITFPRAGFRSRAPPLS